MTHREAIHNKNKNDWPDPEFLSKQVKESDYFFIDLHPPKDQPFTVACGGLENCNLDYRMARTRFSYYAIEYIVSGLCRLTVGGQSYHLKAGSIFCYGPETPHRIENKGDSPLVKFFVNFTGQDVDQVIGEKLSTTSQPYQMPNLRGMYELFHQLLEIGQEGGRGCQRILLLLIRLISTQVEHKSVELEDYASRSYTTYERCLSFMEQKFPSLSSIAELAAECHISTGYLSRIFQRYAGESPSRMLNRMKMNRAGELLLTKNLLIKEVADQTGFPDPYHFSRLFKQHFGMSPKAFRQSIKRA